MRYLPIYKVEPGMILGRDMYDFTNEALLRRGKVLNENLIKRLWDFGYQGLYIDDEFSSDLEIEELLTLEMRTRALDSLKELDVDAAMDVAEEVADKILKADSISIDMIDLRSFDDYTYYHSINVAVLATIVGMGMGYSAKELQDLCIAGMFHDIGKVDIDPKILNKPSQLTREEFEIIKQHPRKAYEFLGDKWNISADVKMGVLCHHENEDGSGYPFGYAGDKIPHFAKILHVVDVYDALSTKRPYKKAYARSEALEYLMGGSTTMFDEKVVNVFMQYVPVYPKGMGVILSDGREGVICENNRKSSLRPKVRLLDGSEIDLIDVEKYSTLTILKQNDEDAITAEEIEKAEQKRRQMRNQNG